MAGYSEKVKKKLKSVSATAGDRIKVKKKGETWEGLLMPRTEGGDSNHLVLKLDNGYNVGIEVTSDVQVDMLEGGEEPQMEKRHSKVEPDPEKPDVTILGTGGTVASRIDYRTGAVHPAFSTSEIYSMAPEIAETANIETRTICNVLSENITPKLWTEIGKAAAEELNGGADGLVIAHGTDTMGYTASALSFMLRNLHKPVVLVGSQRSSDRPSSDATLNLIHAVSTAVSDLAGVYVVMHGSTEDEFSLIHRGTKVRKCHTSRRDAFQSINEPPVGLVKDGEITCFQGKKERKEEKVNLEGGFEEKVALIKVFPNIQKNIIQNLLKEGYKGIVLEGTGLGHAPESLYEGIEKAAEQEIPVAMTSQCIWGRTNMRVYSTGRDLLNLGIFQLEDMLPETAYVKMMWVLDKTQDRKEVESLMKRELAGEITPRTRADVFLKPELPKG